MQPVEYERLARIDREHWFYRGKRAIVRHWLERTQPLGRDDLLIDAGMGTGTWLEEMAGACRVVGLDDHDESLAIAGPRVRSVGGEVLKTSLVRIPLADGCASAVTAMDVLEHLREDVAALRELVRITRPGGVIVVTVPAMPSLWSDWDVALHHVRRYRRSGLRTLLGQVDVDVLRLSHFNAAAIGPAWFVRSWRRFRQPADPATWAEHRIPKPWLNRALERVMVGTACWDWPRTPIGLSLLAVLRRRLG